MKNDKMIKELSCIALAAIIGFVSFADTFPNAGGDIADETEWGGPVPSAVVLNKTGTYTVGSDISLSTMSLDGGEVTLDLTDSSSGNVTISGSGNNGFYITTGGDNTTNYIKGGFWDFLGTGSFGVSKTGTTSGCAKYARLVVSDGAVLTNCNSVKVSFCGAPCNDELILTGKGTTVHTIGMVNILRNAASTDGAGGHLSVLDGASFLWPTTGGNEFYVDYCYSDAQQASVDASVLVSGAGSFFSGNVLRLGGRYRTGASVSICNGGALKLTGKMHIGYEKSSLNACVSVVSNGTANVGSVSVGGHITAHGGKLIVADGGSYSATDYIYCSGDGNGMIISNGTASCATFRFTAGESNTLHVCGSNGVLNCGSLWIGNGGTIATNAMIVLSGKSPSIAVNGDLTYDLSLASSGTIRFKVPEGGYDNTPFRFTGSANFRAKISFDVDCSECLAGKREAFTTTLLETDGTLTINASQLAAAQESVAAQMEAANWRGSLTKVGNSLVLAAKPRLGLSLLIR